MRILTTLVALGLAATATAAGAQPRVLGAADIDQAIEWGTTGDPEPYVLHHARGDHDTSTVVVGAVYTPFLRVALTAKAARLAHQRFTADDVTPAMVEPVVQIAFRWYCCDLNRPDPQRFDSMIPFDQKIATPADRWATPLNIPAFPLRLERRRSVETLADGLPYDDIVAIATYALEAIRPGAEFAIYRDEDLGTVAGTPVRRVVQVGRVTPADVAAWR